MLTRFRLSNLSALALLAILGSASGCGNGGGGETSGEGGGTLTRAQFIEQADSACSTRDTMIQAELQPFLADDPRAIARPAVAQKMVNQVIAPELEAELTDIRLLEQPAKDNDELEVFLTAFKEVIARGRANPLTITAGPKPFAVPERVGRSYGFNVCGEVKLAP
jgi:hypothetical protein